MSEAGAEGATELEPLGSPVYESDSDLDASELCSKWCTIEAVAKRLADHLLVEEVDVAVGGDGLVDEGVAHVVRSE